MAKKRTKKDASEAVEVFEIKEEVGENVSTSEEQVDTLTLEEYLSKVRVHAGLVASFQVEARKRASLAEPKTMDGWNKAFERQSKRVYK